MTEIPLTPLYREWAEVATLMFGESGEDLLDILTVDAIVSKPDPKTNKSQTYILEVNGTASGWNPDHAEESNQQLAKLVLKKLHHLYDH